MAGYVIAVLAEILYSISGISVLRYVVVLSRCGHR